MGDQGFEQGSPTRLYVPFVPRLLVFDIVLISISVIPVLLQDITERLDRWCEVGRTDPFTEVYGVSFSEACILWE